MLLTGGYLRIAIALLSYFCKICPELVYDVVDFINILILLFMFEFVLGFFSEALCSHYLLEYIMKCYVLSLFVRIQLIVL